MKATILRFVPITERPSEIVERAAARLRATREALGIAQQDMARACGAEPQRWSNWEAGRHLPDPVVMVRAQTLFGISLDWIYGGVVNGLPYGLISKLQASAPQVFDVASDAASPQARSRA